MGSHAARALTWEEGDLRQVVRGLAQSGEHPAILYFADGEQKNCSYSALAEWVNRLSRRLRMEELGDNRRVALLAANSPAWIAVGLAVIEAGGVIVPLDAKLDEESLRHALADSAPALVLTDVDDHKRVTRLCPDGIEPRLLGDFARTDDQSDVDHGHGSGNNTEHQPEEPPTAPDRDATAVIFYTSGTTGPPKGVPLSHRNLLFELHRLLEVGLMAPGERLLLPLPLHHVYPFVMGMLAPLVYGVAIVLPRSMTGPHILQASSSFDVATVIGVPRLYEALVSAIEARAAGSGIAARLAYRGGLVVSRSARRRLSLRLGKILLRPLHRRFGPKLRLMACGGAALDADLAWTLEGMGWTVATGYGLTETSPLVSLVPPGDTHFDSAGRPLPQIELRIAPLASGGDDTQSEDGDAEAGEDDRPAGQEVGEIQLRGPNVFEGYLGLPDKTAEAFTEDGWYRTEDRGYLDAEGYLHVLGRASTFVVTAAGKNISLEELERAYGQPAAVKEIGIFLRDNRLCALAVPDPSILRESEGGDADKILRDAVKEAGRQQPRYKRIDELIVARDALARTRLGKIQRDKLRRRFDTIREEGETVKSGPLPIEEMPGDDQALLEHPPARAAWDFLAKRFEALRLTPDSDVATDLGVDSLEWINLTLEIRERSGASLSEEATSRIESVRDLLQEVVEGTSPDSQEAISLEEHPESYLSERQRHWLRPLNPIEQAFAWLLYWVNRSLVRTFFRLEVSGLENLHAADPTIVTPNHMSVLDPFVIAAAIPYDRLKRSAFAGWTGLAFANPLFRFVVRLGRTLPVEHDRAAFSSLAVALVALREGMSLIWFPEGARSKDGTLQPFMPGIGALLERQPMPVVPTVVSGTFQAMPPGQRLPRPQRVHVRFGPAIPAEELQPDREDGHDTVAEALRGRIADLQKEARFPG